MEAWILSDGGGQERQRDEPRSKRKADREPRHRFSIPIETLTDPTLKRHRETVADKQIGAEPERRADARRAEVQAGRPDHGGVD